MATGTRRERERAQREEMIVRTARELAEAEGWDAVTTRRLAAEIEYSQPVLYSHFTGKAAIMTAVATQGFEELAQLLRTARSAARDAGGVRAALAAVARAYTDFAQERPALYDAMFTHAVELRFADPEGPDVLRAGFGELLQAVEPLAGGDDPGVLTETFWAGLHGLATLERSGRLPGSLHDRRLELLVGRFAPADG
ncbi:TetR/AcrR family transcriptional regulator [Promicromonospora thailandica]|uniref:Transcriptional regulator, TetR family n=1 Tax=Promicromonospora thailandica TaxID=765201 RepID=A0A9X2FZU7_9MICO|nr:TetR/AcrR family transcriptional regulator [Promicromonospora thailandica]MCP2262768.1 transcriptional regulator, TetR family [Promicromonospora thailandica]BFF18093.1 TetR/AcrR family transcriptional regulator [Promicromonospora thailandica]